MKSFSVEMTTPHTHELWDAVTYLDVPGLSGRLSVLADHQPLLCGLQEGELYVDRVGEARQTRHIGPGVLTVARNRVKLVVEKAG